MTCRVVIAGLPPAAGCPDGKTWRSAAGFVRSRLAGRFGSAVSFEYLDLFSPEMASHPEIEALIEAGARAPLVLIDEEMQSFGGKLHVSAIERAVAQRLAATSGALPTEELVS
jgi:hypothetical protein